MRKTIAQLITINKPFKEGEFKEGGLPKLEFKEVVLAERVEVLNNFCIDKLYEAYLDTDISRVFVIEMKNFREFLNRYLPVYFKEKNL